jgi:hypothetical protein
MSDLTNFLFPDDNPVLCNVASVLCGTFAVYISGIMVRQLWHQRQTHISRVVMAVVRRELCSEYRVMLGRLPVIHCFERHMNHKSEKGACTCINTKTMTQANKMGAIAQMPNSPRVSSCNHCATSKIVDNSNDSGLNDDNMIDNSSHHWIQSPSDPFADDFSNIIHTTKTHNVNGISQMLIPHWRATLINNISNFIEFKQMRFLSDSEQRDIIERCVDIVGKRIKCGDSDATRHVQPGLV